MNFIILKEYFNTNFNQNEASQNYYIDDKKISSYNERSIPITYSWIINASIPDNKKSKENTDVDNTDYYYDEFFGQYFFYQNPFPEKNTDGSINILKNGSYLIKINYNLIIFLF